MATDLTIGLVDRPGSLQQASDVLGRAGVNIEGACGFVCEGQGVYHLLIDDAELACRTLIDAGFEIQARQQVVVTPVENRPGAIAAILRRVADAQVNIDFLYITADGGLVLAGDDMAAIRSAVT